MSHKSDPEDRIAEAAEQALSTAFQLAKQATQQLWELYKDYQKKPGLSDDERIAKIVSEVLKQTTGPSKDLDSNQLKELLAIRVQQEDLLQEKEQLLQAKEQVLSQDADLNPERQAAQKDLVKDLDKKLKDVDSKLDTLDEKQVGIVGKGRSKALDPDSPEEGRKMKPGSIGESLEKEGYFKKQSQGPAIKVGTPKLPAGRL
jgi:hypothetical protein